MYSGNSKWEFSTDQVIQFLQSKRDANIPAWERMTIIEGLVTFRIEVQGRSAEDLVPLQTKMVEIIAIERAKNGDPVSFVGSISISPHFDIHSQRI